MSMPHYSISLRPITRSALIAVDLSVCIWAVCVCVCVYTLHVSCAVDSEQSGDRVCCTVFGD